MTLEFFLSLCLVLMHTHTHTHGSRLLSFTSPDRLKPAHFTVLFAPRQLLSPLRVLIFTT